MNRLLVMAAADGSSVILGEDPADARRPFRLVFEHEGDGVRRPVDGHLSAQWVTVDGRRHVVFAGDTRDEADVDRVLLEIGDDLQTCRVRCFSRNPRVWMSFPHAFESGMVVTASWLADDRVVFTETTPPLQWGGRYPDWPAPPAPEPPDVPSPFDDPSGWTGYAPG